METRTRSGVANRQVLSHDPKGKWQGALTLLRLDHIYKRWRARLQTITGNKPSFEWEIRHRFWRYKHGTHISGIKAKVTLANHWTNSDNVRRDTLGKATLGNFRSALFQVEYRWRQNSTNQMRDLIRTPIGTRPSPDESIGMIGTRSLESRRILSPEGSICKQRLFFMG